MKRLKCVRDSRIFREDYEAGKVYEVDDELASRLLHYTIQVGSSHHKGFVLAGAEKAPKKTAKKATKKVAGKKMATKQTKKKSAGPASPMTL